MFKWPLRNRRNYLDQEFSDLSLMLIEDTRNPTYQRDFLNPERLDFSLESLRHIDEYLEHIWSNPPEGNDFLRMVLRVGAYAGETMRRVQPKLHWVSHKEAAKMSDLVSKWEESIATSGILWGGKESFSFPLAKVCKYMENGSEDSLYLFAKVLLERSGARL